MKFLIMQFSSPHITFIKSKYCCTQYAYSNPFTIYTARVIKLRWFGWPLENKKIPK